MKAIGSALRRIAALIDDALPMPGDQREQRDWTPMDSEEVARRRRLRLKLHMAGKRGKGGSR